MGDDKAGLALHQLPHGRLDLDFRAGVHVGGGLIQNQHFGVQQHGPGNGEQLLLPLGDVHAVLVQNGVVTLGQAHDVPVDAGGLGGLLHLLQGGALLAVGQVLKDGARKQPGVLQHHGVGEPQAFPGDLLDVPAVQGDSAGLGVVKAHQQID